MTHPIRTAAASVAAAALLLPAGASAQGGGPGHGGDFAGQGQGQVPARVKAKVKRVVKTLDRVGDHASDGEDTAALAAIAKLDKAIASAQRVAVKRVGTDSGPASVGRVASADDEVATTTADLLDGASAELTTGLAGSLDKALDSRDALVAAVAALDADGQADYADVLERIAEDSADEAEAFTEGATDDEVTEAGATALRDAATQATATAAAAGALAGDDTTDTVSDDDSGDVADDTSSGDRGDCPAGQRGGRGGDAATQPGQSSGNAQEGLSRRA